MNIFKFTKGFCYIYCPTEDMMDFLNLQGKLKLPTLTTVEFVVDMIKCRNDDIPIAGSPQNFGIFEKLKFLKWTYNPNNVLNSRPILTSYKAF